MTVKINPEALENAAKRLALIMSYGERDMHWRALDDRQKQITTQYAREVVTKALGRLNADTLRQLPQVQELMAEAWDGCADDLLALNGGDDRDFTAGYLKGVRNPYRSAS